MEEVADRGMTVVLSSHIVSDLEHVCDHVIVLSAARVQLAGPIDSILSEHRVLTGPLADPATLRDTKHVVRANHTQRQTTLLVRADGHVYDARWEIHDVRLEEVALAYFEEAVAS